MFDQEQEHNDYHYASDAELDQAEAYEYGEAHRQECWISTSRDVWHRNPFYKGFETIHPEAFTGNEEEDAQMVSDWEDAQDEWELEQSEALSKKAIADWEATRAEWEVEYALKLAKEANK